MNNPDLVSRASVLEALINRTKERNSLSIDEFEEDYQEGITDGILEAVAIIESIPPAPSLEKELEGLPFWELRRAKNGYFEALSEECPEGYWVGTGKTPLEAVLALKEALKSKP